jgi:hypothetical protein
MGYICCLGGFIEPSKSLGGKYEPSEKFRGQKQTLFKEKQAESYKTNNEKRKLRRMKIVKRTAAKGCWELK